MKWHGYTWPTLTLFVAGMTVLGGVQGCTRSTPATLPQEVILNAPAPGGSVEAEVLRTAGTERFNLLGSDERFYLALRYGDTRYIVARDLSEGAGTYEGGILGLRWLNDHEVLVERTVSDHRADLVFDASEHKWREVATQ